MYGSKKLDRLYAEVKAYHLSIGATKKEAEIQARNAVNRETENLADYGPGDRSMYGPD